MVDDGSCSPTGGAVHLMLGSDFAVDTRDGPVVPFDQKHLIFSSFPRVSLLQIIKKVQSDYKIAEEFCLNSPIPKLQDKLC